ncbi:general stress protein [Streptomyces xantholiticus]|uniref:General stress protein n=1 Tax=Streptomyces xantholiticus TaxID=68285 RepID=A0ABV1V648_9ACTN
MRNKVASYDSYEEAQAAVDRLSDERFPVEYLDIIGSDLRLVEHVTGRLTKSRAAAVGGRSLVRAARRLAGGALHAGAGLVGTDPGRVALRRLVGGAVLGWAGHAATGGRRDFSSTRTLAASRYDLVARGGHAEQGRVILQRDGMGGTP